MFITRTTLKTEAKKRLAGQTRPSALVTFVTFFVPQFILPSGLGPLIVDGPFSAGMANFFLQLIRGQNPGMGTMFQGFSNFWRNIRLWLLQVVFVVLWGLLLVVPGVVAALRYSMAWFVAVDEPELTAREVMERSKQLTKGRLRDLFALAVSFVWWVGFGIITLGIGFLYAVPYIQTTWALVYEGLKAAEVRPQASPELPV
jgi:uncharacterized membrane protein